MFRVRFVVGLFPAALPVSVPVRLQERPPAQEDRVHHGHVDDAVGEHARFDQPCPFFRGPQTREGSEVPVGAAIGHAFDGQPLPAPGAPRGSHSKGTPK